MLKVPAGEKRRGVCVGEWGGGGGCDGGTADDSN